MRDGFSIFLFIIAIVLFCFFLGIATGESRHKDNTYECTLACGTQNYEVDGTCFCKSKP